MIKGSAFSVVESETTYIGNKADEVQCWRRTSMLTNELDSFSPVQTKPLVVQVFLDTSFQNVVDTDSKY